MTPDPSPLRSVRLDDAEDAALYALAAVAGVSCSQLIREATAACALYADPMYGPIADDGRPRGRPERKRIDVGFTADAAHDFATTTLARKFRLRRPVAVRQAVLRLLRAATSGGDPIEQLEADLNPHPYEVMQS